jgi:hypothetical protein
LRLRNIRAAKSPPGDGTTAENDLAGTIAAIVLVLRSADTGMIGLQVEKGNHDADP